MQLHRAIVSSARLEGECIVFFETSASTPARALENALSILWSVPAESLEIYNCSTEWQQVNQWAVGDKADGDLRLFETGFGGGDIGEKRYAQPERTLFLVRPETLRRLARAQARVLDRLREQEEFERLLDRGMEMRVLEKRRQEAIDGWVAKQQLPGPSA